MTDSNPNARPPIAYPRRQLGPDAVACLRSFSRTLTGDRHAFDACRVQRAHTGEIAWTIKPDLMEHVGIGHEHSYGYLIRNVLIPAAERIEAQLAYLPERDRLIELDKMLKKIGSGDGLTYWLMSTRAIRRMLFPAAHDPVTGARSDNVMYVYDPNDTNNATRVLLLRGLDRSAVEAFSRKAVYLSRHRINPSHVTPPTLNH